MFADQDAQGPNSKFLMTRKSDTGSYFIPKKITTSEFVYPKTSLLYLAYSKKSLSPFFATPKNPSVFFATQKNSGVFHRPKKIPFGQNFRPKKITRTPPPPSLKYVSGTSGPGCYCIIFLHICFFLIGTIIISDRAQKCQNFKNVF